MATPAAREAITALRAAGGGPLMFVQSGGCCAGSTPMCFPVGEFVIGDIDVLLGVAAGGPEDVRLPAGDDLRFVTIFPPASHQIAEAPPRAVLADCAVP